MPSRSRRLYRKRDRYYADFRDFSDVGGAQEALIPDGARTATRDAELAEVLMARRLVELHELRTGRRIQGPFLAEYMDRHLELKACYRAESTVERDRQALRNVLEYFGEDVRLTEIDVAGLQDYIAHRRRQPGVPAGTTISPQTVLHELHALSSLYKRARSEDVADRNPVRRLPNKPTVRRNEATWLEPGEAWRLLEAAAVEDAIAHPNAVGFLRPLVATYLLTGARYSEVLGMLRRDVDLEREVVHVRPNQHRGLKTSSSKRWIPLWPQLATILTTYLDGEPRAPGELLFPSPATGKMLTDFRKSLDTALEAAEIEKHVRPTTFRHTYASVRVQTTDGGSPVSLFTVARELGHRSTARIRETYGHLTRTRSRRDVVEYREGEVVGEIGGAERDQEAAAAEAEAS